MRWSSEAAGNGGGVAGAAFVVAGAATGAFVSSARDVNTPSAVVAIKASVKRYRFIFLIWMRFKLV